MKVVLGALKIVPFTQEPHLYTVPFIESSLYIDYLVSPTFDHNYMFCIFCCGSCSSKTTLGAHFEDNVIVVYS